MSKAFGEQNPTQGEDAVSWSTWHNGVSGSVVVEGDPDWGRLKLTSDNDEGRSAVYDFGNTGTNRKLTITENRYGTGTGTATIQIRGDVSSFNQDDNAPIWEIYTGSVSKAYRYIQVRATTRTIWWLAGDIPSANCLFAYQPKGADDYLSSKINLANPGTRNAEDGTNYPTWTGSTGWFFSWGSSQYLTVNGGSTDTKPLTILAYINRVANRYTSIIGPSSSGGYQLRIDLNSNKITFLKSQVTGLTPSNSQCLIEDVAGFTYDASGNYVYYLNGAADGNGTTDLTFTSSNLYIGGSSSGEEYFDGYMFAISVYDIVLTAAQALAVSNAMLAL